MRDWGMKDVTCGKEVVAKSRVSGSAGAGKDRGEGTGRPRSCREYTLSGVVELDVPVQVVAPAVRRIAESDGDADGRCGFGAFRGAQHPHAGLDWRPPALTAIAADAAGDDVLPIFAAA